MLNGLQPWHVIILVVVVVLLFGAKKLPDAARSLGKSMRIFKSEIHEMKNDTMAETPAETARPAPPTPVESTRVDTPAPETHTDARPA